MTDPAHRWRATALAASNAVVKASPKGFSLQSADGQNQVKLRGVLHFDGRNFNDDVTPAMADTWGLRRARPALPAARRSSRTPS